MVSLNKALLGPYFLGGGGIGVVPLGSHDCMDFPWEKSDWEDNTGRFGTYIPDESQFHQITQLYKYLELFFDDFFADCTMGFMTIKP